MFADTQRPQVVRQERHDDATLLNAVVRRIEESVRVVDPDAQEVVEGRPVVFGALEYLGQARVVAARPFGLVTFDDGVRSSMGGQRLLVPRELVSARSAVHDLVVPAVLGRRRVHDVLAHRFTRRVFQQVVVHEFPRELLIADRAVHNFFVRAMFCACGRLHVFVYGFAFSVLSGCKIDNAISKQFLLANRAINDFIM